MHPRGLAKEHRAALLRVVADRQHVIEILTREFIHMLRALGRNVNADFLQYRYRLGANGTWLRASAFHRETVSGIAPQQAFGHLRPRRISSGRNQQIYQWVTHDKAPKIRWSTFTP
jgi:hypothetical protein